MARPRHDEPEEDDPDDWDGDDYDAERDYDPDDPETYPEGLYVEPDLPTVACPHCAADILEDAERCPECGKYISREDAPAGSHSTAWIVLVLLALAAILMSVAG